jgi:hypothetical protein
VENWLPATIIPAYAGLVILMALAAVFSETPERREAAYKVLRAVLPWGVDAILIEVAVAYYGPRA